jgi:hypothetical protein
LGRVSPQEACEVCGRTFLVGEKVHSYVSVEGRHEVCELCVDRVAAAGWLPADQEGAEERLRAEAERKPGFLGRLFSRAESDGEDLVGDEADHGRDEADHGRDEAEFVRGEADFVGDEADTEEPPAQPRAPRRRAIHELETERYDVEAEWREEEGEGAPSPRRGRSEWPAAEDADRDAGGPSPVRRRLSRLFAPRRQDAEAEARHGRPADLPAPDRAEARRAEGLPAPASGDARPPADASAPGAAEARVDLPADVPHGHAADLPSPDTVPEPQHSPPPAAPAPPADASPAPLPDPAGRGMRPRRLQPDLSPATRFERAIARFNSSDAGRTAAGLTRTLGAPSVSVGDLAGEEDIVRITVAWELTWYQWGVDLGDELRPVFELDKGYEVSEIDAAARQWNASAHDGRIVMVAPRRQEAADGRPVHR